MKYVDPSGEDYAIYFTESEDENGKKIYTATISATYYDRKGNYDEKKSAEDATGYWNSKNGEYTYTVGKGENAVKYDVKFDLKVVEADDPISQVNADRRIFEVEGETKLVIDGSSNTYRIVKDDYTSKHGEYGNGAITVEKSDKDTKVGAHEIGYSINIDHSMSGLIFNPHCSFFPYF